MPVEIERKFLVHTKEWEARSESSTQAYYAQGYLCSDKERTVRVRITPDQAFLTIKGAPAPGTLARAEFEYPIPQDHASQMLSQLCSHSLEKTRYKIPMGAHIWEVDVFHGSNAPLILAEIELQDEHESFEKPAWIAQEVSGDFRYSNSYLAAHPFGEWN